MLNALKDFFESLLPPAADSQHPAQLLEVATAVLLIEVMRADAQWQASERAAVVAALQRQFTLTDAQTTALLQRAEDTSRHATDFFSFTSQLNEQLTMEQKVRVVEDMWTVAFADGVLSNHEDHVLWRISDLLHVPHGAYIHAKLRAQQAANGG